MTAPTPDPEAFWLARLAAAQPAEHDRRLTALEAQQTTSTVALAALAQQIHNLEESLMVSVDDVVSRLNTATSEIAADLQALRDQLQSVRDQIPAAQQAAVDAALAQLDAPIARLEALGQDPANPVPPADGGGEPTPTPEPTPGDGGGTDVVNPTVDADGNPV